MKKLKKKITKILRWSEQYTRTDMVYAAKGGFWVIMGRGALALISFATLAAFAHWLPARVFGEYQFVLAVAGILAVFSLPGMKTALVRSVAKGFEGSLLAAFKTKFLWSLIASGILLGGAGWYLFHFNFTLATAFFVVALFFPLKSASPVFIEFWRGKKRFDTQVVYQVIADLGVATAVIATLFITDELWIIVAVFFGVSALCYGLAYVLSQRGMRNTDVDEEMVSFGKHLTLMGVINLAASHLDKILLWKIVGPVQLAVYAFALKPIEKVVSAAPIKTLVLPKLSENGVRGEARKKSVFRKFLLLFLFTVPAAVLLAVTAPFIYGFVFPQYGDSVVYFQFLSVLIATLPFSVLTASLVAEKKVGFMYINNTVAPIMKIVLFIVLTPFWGVAGIVSAIVLTEVLRGGLGLFFFWRM